MTSSTYIYSDFYFPTQTFNFDETAVKAINTPTTFSSVHSRNSPVIMLNKEETVMRNKSMNFFEPIKAGYQSVFDSGHFLPIIQQPPQTLAPFPNKTAKSLYSITSTLPQIYQATNAIAPSPNYTPKYAPSKNYTSPSRIFFHR